MSEELDRTTKEMKDGFRVSNHTFINLAIQGLANKLAVASDKIKITPTNKQDRNNFIKVEMISQHIADSDEELSDTKLAVEKIMQQLNNETNLINLLGK